MVGRGWSRLCGALGCAVLFGCTQGAPEVKSAFSISYDCAEPQVVVKRLYGDRYEASGCGKQRHYTCTTEYCYIDTAVPTVTADDFVGKGKLFYSATLEPDALLKVSAWTEQDPRVELQLLTARGRVCDVAWLVDGQPLPLGSSSVRAPSIVPPALLVDLAQAKRVSMQACGGDWALNDEQLRDLHRAAEIGLAGLARPYGLSGGDRGRAERAAAVRASRTFGVARRV